MWTPALRFTSLSFIHDKLVIGISMTKRKESTENQAAETSNVPDENGTVTGNGPQDETAPGTAAGQRITRRTVDRTTTKEHIEETVTEAVPLWAPGRSAYPAPVG